MTKAQQVYERVEALVASGVRKAEAFQQVADEFEQPFNTTRGAYYTHSRSLGTSTPRSRKGEAANGDPIEQATIVLSKAIESIDEQVAAAKARIELAKAEYEQLRDTAQERKSLIQTKLDALKA